MWTLKLLGGCRLVGPAGTLGLERKPAALLAYLALEGPTSRARLAELLWPEWEERAQRNNLRQVLFRLRRAAPLFSGSDPLHLSVPVDVLEFVAALQSHRPLPDPGWLEGTLLGGFEYDDCPDFDEWLQVERERLLTLRLEALEGEAERLEREGHLSQALGYARRLVEADPVSEAAYRRLMRLHYLLGDRAAALQTFARAQEALRRELGVEPLQPTVELAQAIARDEAEARPQMAPSKAHWPQPPTLVGREREWAALEAAWAEGQVIVVRGAPGIGKSRLLREFAASKGRYALYEARPGDRVVPYATFARFVRENLEAYPERLGSLAPWVRRELTRLLPDLLPDGEPPPLSDAAAKLRFFQAMGEWALKGNQGVASILAEDLQHFDPASTEVELYLISSVFKVTQPQPRLLFTLRSAEAPELEQALEAAGDRVAILDLGPLEPQAVEALVAGEAQDQPELAVRLFRSTGGNPFFVIETLRALAERGEWSGPLPLAEQVGELLEARLARLSAGARQLAALVAVAGEDYTPVLAAQALETIPLVIAEREGELEEAGVLESWRFTHDLMGEAVVNATPPALRRYLHARLGELLQASGGNPARVAHHWMEAGEPERAWEPLLQAAEAALEAGVPAQAQAWLERLSREAPPRLAHRAKLHLGVLAMGRDAPRAEALLQEVIQRAEPSLRTEARAALAQLYTITGQPARGLVTVLKAQEELPAGSPALQASLFQAEFEARWRMSDFAGAEQALRRALELDPGPHRAVALGLLLWSQGRYREEIAVLSELLQARPGDPWLGVVHNNLAFAHFALGELDQAIAGFERALAMGEALGELYDAALARLNLGTALISRGEYRRAKGLLEAALAGYTQVGAALGLAEAHSRLGLLQARAGRWEEARQQYTQSLERMRPIGDTFRIAYVLAGLAEAQVGCGDLQGAQAAAEEALLLAQAAPQPYALAYALMAMSLVRQRRGAREEALGYAQEAVALSERFEMAEQLARSLLFLHDAAPEGPRAGEALVRCLGIAQERDIPDLVWRAARRLAPQEGYARRAEEALARLQAQAPAGWELAELA
jgi:DNA-binding SARP family transcriptional activator